MRIAPWLLAGVLAIPTITAQSWQPLLPRAAAGVGMAYDSARDCTVLFGGIFASGLGSMNRSEATWELHASGWHQRRTPHTPRSRAYTGMVFDSARGRTILFGGEDATGAMLAETWEYDGVDWTFVTTANLPPPRAHHHMVYDAVRGRTVLFGGLDAQSLLGDTWEYDGTDWVQVNTATSPPARFRGAMAYGNGTTVLHGGTGGGFGGELADTWRYDGANWTQVTSVLSPNERQAAAMGFDAVRNRFVLYGGQRFLGLINFTFEDTWEFDGNSWMAATPSMGPPPRHSSAVVWRDGSADLLLFGGQEAGSLHRGSWTFDGSAWAPLPVGEAHAVRDFGLAYDRLRDRTVLFGGVESTHGLTLQSETWELAGNLWSRRATATVPPARMNGSMTYDNRRSRVVMFGGEGVSGSVLGDTWEYDGTDWLQQNLATSPPARVQTAVAYDMAREVVVMFGGANHATFLADTWEYDGNTWHPIAVTNPPPAQRRHALTYDRQRERIVLVPGTPLTVFEYDGIDWSYAGSQPISHAFGSAAYDTARGVTVAHPELYTYEYSGTWTSYTYPDPPLLATGGAVVYDDARNAVVRVGTSGDTDVFVAAAVPSWASIGPGCPGSVGTPELTSTPPALGGSMDLTLSQLPPTPGAAFVLFGFYSPTRFGQPLPRDLGPFGLPGCRLWIDSLAGAGPLLLHGGGQTAYSLPIPNVSVFAGLRLFHQAFVVDPSAPNGFGVLSNGAVGTVR